MYQSLFNHLLTKGNIGCLRDFLIGLLGFFIESSMRWFYILEINSLSVALFAKIFSNSVGCIFVVVFFLLLFFSCFVFYGVLHCAKVFEFNEVQFACFCFYFHYSRGGSNILLQFMSKSVPPMFSYRIILESGLTFRFLTHFEFIFVYSFTEYSNFILLHVAVHFSQHHLLKILSFLHCIFLPHLS